MENNMKRFVIGYLALFTMFLFTETVKAQVPKLMSVQGMLADANNVPLKDGLYTMYFSIYDLEVGGVALYKESFQVQLSNGRYMALLGERNALNLAFDKQYWLTMSPDSANEGARIRLTTSPYAFTASHAMHADTASFAVAAHPVGSAGGSLNGSYPNPTLAPGSVTTSAIANESITLEKISKNLIFLPSGPASGDITGDYPNPKIAAGAVKTDRLADLAVTSAKIATGTIDSINIKNKSISGTHIKDSSINSSKLGGNVVMAPVSPSSFFTQTDALMNTNAVVGPNTLLVGISSTGAGSQGWLNGPTAASQVLSYNGNNLVWSKDSVLFPVITTGTANGAANAMMGLTNLGDATTARFVSSTGNAVHAITPTIGTAYAGLFEGNVHVTGDIKKTYRAGSAPQNAVPVAYASVALNGQVRSGSANMGTVAWNGNDYEIDILGEVYNPISHIVNVTANTVSTTPVPVVPLTSLRGNRLVITFYTLAGATTQSDFHFTVMKP
jgi:hypothetical protein